MKKMLMFLIFLQGVLVGLSLCLILLGDATWLSYFNIVMNLLFFALNVDTLSKI